MGDQPRASIVRPPVHRITGGQLLVLAPLLVVLVWLAPVWGLSAAAGVMIEVSGRAYFAFYAFRFAGARQMRDVMRSFRRGELGKFMLVTLLFGAVFALWREAQPVAVFVGYFLAWLLGTVLGMRWLK